MWFPSLVQILYLVFIASQIYALFLQFFSPSTGSVDQTKLVQIKLLSVVAFAISFPSIFATSLPSAVSHSANTGLVHLLAWLLLSASFALFAWSANTTGRGNLSVIFAKVTPGLVIDTGPYALVRHPVYVSYVLGWLGSLLAIAQEWKHNATFFGLVRVVAMAVCVMGLCGLYSQGAEVEERQFMLNEDVVKGQSVELGVRRRYESYKSVVGARWIPGII
jgi:protein-S-isoprenylcysteine O-methyltransferase Ste14